MSVTSDKDKFFQTSDSLEKATRRAAKSKNTLGDPIHVGAKILDIISDPTSPDRVFIAQSDALARRVQLSSGDKGNHVYRGHTAPVTSLALSDPPTTLFTGSWDKSILAFDVNTRTLLLRFPPTHADFIKTLLYLPSRSPTSPSTPSLLLSGSSDTKIIIWNPETATKLHVLAAHTRGVLSLVLDPIPPPSDPTGFTVFSSGSERAIYQWTIPSSGTAAIQGPLPPLTPHETSVYKLRFSLRPPYGDLYTASADNTVQRIAIRASQDNEDALPTSQDSFPHPDFVNDVLVTGFNPSDEDDEGRWIVTACRDENVRVWDRATANLTHVFEGHFDEVSGVCVVEVEKGGWAVVSGSIDGTVRRWRLKPEEIKAAVEEARRRKEGREGEEEKVTSGVELTEDEERELEELMRDDE
ncbi:WD40-repeat-containing domain protein [Kalaharituber pfeilii]|nr:WD40-repeat-containing domain protein [Kalaharituber pfeilii]